MGKHGFKSPSELAKKKKEPKEVVSTRIKESAAQELQKAAASQDKTVGWLAGEVLEEYAEWLRSRR